MSVTLTDARRGEEPNRVTTYSEIDAYCCRVLRANIARERCC